MAPKRQHAAATVAKDYAEPSGFSYLAAANFFKVDKDELQVWVVGRMARHMDIWGETKKELILSKWPVAKAALHNKYDTLLSGTSLPYDDALKTAYAIARLHHFVMHPPKEEDEFSIDMGEDEEEQWFRCSWFLKLLVKESDRSIASGVHTAEARLESARKKASTAKSSARKTTSTESSTLPAPQVVPDGADHVIRITDSPESDVEFEGFHYSRGELATFKALWYWIQETTCPRDFACNITKITEERSDGGPVVGIDSDRSWEAACACPRDLVNPCPHFPAGLKKNAREAVSLLLDEDRMVPMDAPSLGSGKDRRVAPRPFPHNPFLLIHPLNANYRRILSTKAFSYYVKSHFEKKGGDTQMGAARVRQILEQICLSRRVSSRYINLDGNTQKIKTDMPWFVAG